MSGANNLDSQNRHRLLHANSRRAELGLKMAGNLWDDKDCPIAANLFRGPVAISAGGAIFSERLKGVRQ